MVDAEPSIEVPQGIELAGTLIFDDQGRFLLIHRKTEKNDQWETIGGGVEPGESVEDAAIREAREEAGVDIRPRELLGVLKSTENGIEINYSLFAAKIIAGKPKPLEPKHKEIKFWSLYDLRSTDEALSPNVHSLLAAISAGEIDLSKQTSQK